MIEQDSPMARIWRALRLIAICWLVFWVLALRHRVEKLEARATGCAVAVRVK